ncbi:MAG: hypothetical protein R3195_00595 [Gemmatimonadota bacterium]|nr:hypothetical protein [Gemmatimonadota bacterium]
MCRSSNLSTGCRAAITAVIAAACGEVPHLDPAGPDEPALPGSLPSAVRVVSGQEQRALAGQLLPEPLVVRVIDAAEVGVYAVPVDWSVLVGKGRLSGQRATRSGGYAEMRFEPTALGAHQVAAQAIAIRDSFDATVIFDVVADGVQIEIDDDFGWSNFGFFAPDESENRATVPVGTPVEWVNFTVEAHTVRSIAAPSGGAHFDSGLLQHDERFRFVPEVAGTWTYIDDLTGTEGALTAVPGG